MAVIVYDHPLSPYAQKVKIALLEKGVPFEAPLPEAIGSGESGGRFAEVSPRGEVPALLDDDTSVFDSTVILEYVEDRWPAPPLLPTTPAERAQVRMLEDVMDTHYEAINWGLSEIENFHRATGEPAERMKSRAAGQIARWQGWLTAQLGDRPWFNGGEFGWGDLAVVPFLNGSTGFGLGPEPDSALGRWLARANERESVVSVTEAARRMQMGGSDEARAGLAAVRERMERGEFKREYRDHRLEWMIKTGGFEVVREGLEKDNIRFTHEFTP